MDRRRFRGVGPAVVTPMHADGSVDLEGFARHVEFLIEGGVHFLVPCGTTGESATLTVAEQARLIEKTVEVSAGRVPVMAGAGTNDTREAVERVHSAVRAGADAILSVSPYYNKPTQEGLYRHYMTLADAAGVPLFVYTVPGRTAGNVLPETLFRLASAHEMIAGVKEASGDLDQVMRILRDRPDNFLVLSGEDYLTFAMVALGGDGVISVAANEVPAGMSEMVDAAMASDFPRARALHYRLLGLMQANFIETNPIPVKTALEMMGRHHAHFRLPLCELAEKNRERLQSALTAAGVALGSVSEPTNQPAPATPKGERNGEAVDDRAQPPVSQVATRSRATEDLAALRADVERLAANRDADRNEARAVVRRLLHALSEGHVRAAERTASGWQAVQWVKTGILLTFRVGDTRPYHPFAPGSNDSFAGSTLEFFDRNTLPLRHTHGVEDNIRIVPGGSSVRAGAHLAKNVVIMPPAFVNIGAYVDEGTMIDSHALVGSCAQVGKRVHLSAGAQVGGVLEPVGLRPVIIEDDALVAGNTGIFEGTLVGRGAVIAPGVQLTRSTAVYDLVRGQVLRATPEQPLTIPEGAVVVPGSRPAAGDFAKEHGLQLYVPVIVKYRDEKTDASAALEAALR